MEYPIIITLTNEEYEEVLRHEDDTIINTPITDAELSGSCV